MNSSDILYVFTQEEEVANDQFYFLSTLCSQPFWNSTSAWGSENPQLGECFERTVLAWLPCLLLWIFGPFYLLYLRHKPYDPIHWTALSYTKITLLVFLMVLAVVELIWAIIEGINILSTIYLLTPAILLFTYALQLLIVLVGRLHGDGSNGLLWIYWLFVLITSIPQLYSSISSIIHENEQEPSLLIITFILQYIISIAMFISNCFVDAPSKLQKLYLTEKSCPELRASFLSRLIFFYNLPLIWQGWRQPLTADDLWDVNPQDSADYLYRKWEKCSDSAKPPDKNTMNKGNFKGSSEHTADPIRSRAQEGKVNVPRQLWRMTRLYMINTLLLHTGFEVLRLFTPAVLSMLITFISDPTQPQWHGYLYAVTLFACTGSSSLVKNVVFKKVFTQIVRVRSALMAAVYNKALHLSSSARRESTVGQIVNLMAVDANSVGDMFMHITSFVVSPFIIIIVFGLLWQRLGPSAIAGMIVLLFIIPLNSYLMNKLKRTQYKIMKLKDKRVKLVSEIISGIKVLKLYAWENSFADKVKDVRNEELRLLKRLYTIQAFNSFIFNAVPYMVSLATFATYLLSSSENTLDAEKAFVSLSLFNLIRFPVIQMPDMISMFIQARVAMTRIEKYLNSDELDPLAVTRDSNTCGSVKIEAGNFEWESGDDEVTWTLNDINIDVKPGQLVAIVGAVGTGKTSLLSALLGEMKKNSGNVYIGGKVAYVSQQAWLQNASIRDNIIWGQIYDVQRYREVIKACALQPDLDMLPAGDMTEIGEKGINMSGGQKQRVALARAVYTNANVLLLDDPLSAVDSHVGKHIFENVIGPHGILKGKTRILVTHGVAYLSQVDHVCVMNNGCVVEQGTYQTLIERNGNFSQFILQHINTLDEDTVEEELEELLNDTMSGGNILLRQLSRRRDSLRSASRERHRLESESESRYLQTPISRSLAGSNSTLHSPSTPINNLPHKLLTQISKTSSMGTRNGSISSINRKRDLIEMQKLSEQNHKLVQEETTETGKVSRKIYMVYWRAMGLCFAVGPMLCVSLAQGCNAASNVWLSQWSSSESMNNTESVSSEVFLAVYGAIGVGQVSLMCIGIILIMMGGLNATKLLHSNLLNSVIHLPMRFFDTNPSGRIMNRFSKEVDVVDRLLPNNFRAFITTFTQILAAIAVIIGATPITTAFLIPIMIIYLCIQQVFVATSRQLKRLESVSKSPVYSHFSETLTGAVIVRAFMKQDDFFRQSLNKIEKSLKAIYVNVYVNRWLGVHLEGLGNIITFVAAAVGVTQRDTLSPGALGLTVTYALNITTMLNWLIRIVCDTEAHIVSVERIDEYVKLEHEAAWEIKEQCPAPSWPESGTITFNNYKTRYHTGLDLVLKGISCTIQPGEKVGIVGRTGAGKSSLTLALFRIIESTSGSINIDNVPISRIGLHDLRGRISIIPQDPVLFSGSVRMNLDPFGTKSDADIWWSLELAHLSDYIRSQPLGLHHVVDEDGSNFSVGQRQLVCLARALLRNSRVLVLDEATAAVDLETDDLIQTTIRAQFSHCTVLTIAHRLNTIMDSDRVLVLEKGEIAEFETPSNLLQNQASIFYGMAKDAGLV